MRPSNTSEILDRDALLDRVGGDPDFLQEIAGLFREDCPKLLAQIRDAVAGGDPHLLERAAHTLTGSVSNLGAEAARKAGLRLESMGRARDLAGAAEACAALELEIERFAEALEGFSQGLAGR